MPIVARQIRDLAEHYCPGFLRLDAGDIPFEKGVKLFKSHRHRLDPDSRPFTAGDVKAFMTSSCSFTAIARATLTG